jgi:hypothetical protein
MTSGAGRRPIGSVAVWLLITLAGCGADSDHASAGGSAGARETNPPAVDPVGVGLSAAIWTDAAGRSVPVEFAGHGPTALIVLDESDCFSCLDVVPDAWRLERWLRARGGRVLGVVVTREMAVLRDYARRTRLPFELLADTAGWTESRLGSGVHPALLLISSDGTVLTRLGLGTAARRTPRLEVFLAEFARWPG